MCCVWPRRLREAWCRGESEREAVLAGRHGAHGPDPAQLPHSAPRCRYRVTAAPSSLEAHAGLTFSGASSVTAVQSHCCVTVTTVWSQDFSIIRTETCP